MKYEVFFLGFSEQFGFQIKCLSRAWKLGEKDDINMNDVIVLRLLDYKITPFSPYMFSCLLKICEQS